MIGDFFDTLGRFIDDIILGFGNAVFKVGFVIWEWWARLVGLAFIAGVCWVIYKVVYFFLRFYYPSVFGHW